IDTIARGGSKELALLHVALGERFAGAVLELLAQARTSPKDLAFVASHGQTIWHEPGRATLQLGDPAVIAERVGVPVVSDFRARDVAAGGRGPARGRPARRPPGPPPAAPRERPARAPRPRLCPRSGRAGAGGPPPRPRRGRRRPGGRCAGESTPR